MAFGISLGGKKGSSKSTTDLLANTFQKETQAEDTVSTTEQTQQQTASERAVQDILQQTQQEQTQTQRQTGTTNVSGQTTGTGTQQQTAITNLLSGAAQGELENVVLDLLGGIGQGDQGISNIVNLLTERATTAEADIGAQTSAIVSGARSEGEKRLQQLQTQLAQQAGGSLANTQVAAGTAEGRADLETQLASLEAQLGINARETQTQELGQLLQAAGAEESQVVPLLNILKGAQTEQTGTLTTAQQQQQQQQQQQDTTSTAEVLANVIAQTAGTTQTDSISNIISQATTEQQSELSRLLREIKSGRQTTKGKTKSGSFGLSLSGE